MSAPSRLTFIDDARGLAVVLMIFWHTVHGWISPALHESHPLTWDAMRVFGGTAAPMFVALAGVGAAMKFGGDEARGRSHLRSALELFARGMHVVVIGYCLRVYAWTIDDQALTRTAALPAAIPMIVGLALLLHGFDRLAEEPKKSLAAVVAGLAIYALGVRHAFEVEPNKAVYFFKVDVLQAIGASLAIIGVTYAISKRLTETAVAALLGFVLACMTDPLVRSLPRGLPIGVAAYLNAPLPEGHPTLSAFPLFPWVGYAFTGLALGRVWTPMAKAGKGDLAVFGVGAICAAISALANGPAVHLYLLPVIPTLYKGLFMLHKIGFGLALLMVLTVFIRWAGRSPLTELGQTSMVIYWVHLEFAYGLLSKPLKRSLDYGQWALGFAALVLLMALVARLRLRAPTWWANRTTT